MKNQEIKLKNNNHEYSIIIGENALGILPQKIKSLCPKTKKIALIIDRNVPKKYKNELKRKLKNYNLLFLSIKANEKNKSINVVNYYLNILLSKNFNRSDLIIAIGGGITGDVVGLFRVFLREELILSIFLQHFLRRQTPRLVVKLELILSMEKIS